MYRITCVGIERHIEKLITKKKKVTTYRTKESNEDLLALKRAQQGIFFAPLTLTETEFPILV